VKWRKAVASSATLLLVLAAWVQAAAPGDGTQGAAAENKATDAAAEAAVAFFAGGCFWCMEPPFDELPGVLSTTSGYTGGRVANPSYEQVSSGRTGHTEAVEIRYDPTRIGYEELLAVFWRNIDPLAKDRQFCDRGSQYRSGIYAVNDRQLKLARASAKRIREQLGQRIFTEIESAGPFYPAEQYHQDYYEKNPWRYKFYRHNCGRDQRLEELWG